MTKNQYDFKKEMNEWFRKRKDSAEALQALENSIYDFEGSYLAEKNGESNFYIGWSQLLKTRKIQKKKENSNKEGDDVFIKDDERLFSKSSVTSRVYKKPEIKTSKNPDESDDNQTPMRSNKDDVFSYVYSCEIHSNVQLRVVEFEGIFRDPENPTKRLTQLFAEVMVYCNNRPVGYPVSTSFKNNSEVNRQKLQDWSEWLTLPIRYSDLSRDAFIHVTVWEVDIDKTPLDATFSRNLIAQAHLPLFSKRGILRSGVIDLQMTTETREPDPFLKFKQTWKYSDNWNSNVEHLFKQFKRHNRGQIEHVPWLDPFTSRKIEQIRSQQKHSNSLTRNVFIVINMATVRLGLNSYEIVYYEDESKHLRISASLGGVALPFTRTSAADPELNMENLAEIKHNIMTRRIRDGAGDRQLKPNKQAKDRLETIMKLPSSQQLTREQRDLVWKFRYYLKEDRKALNKFLRSVNWDQPQEEQAALALMNDWALIEAEDALELLSPAFTHKSVRAYAVSRLLNAASPEQVLLYLPQLVQALKYEPSVPNDNSSDGNTVQPIEGHEKDNNCESKLNGDLATFLIDNSVVSPRMSNFLYWYLKVEIESAKQTNDEGVEKMYSALQDRLLAALMKKDETKILAESLNNQIQFVEDLKKITSESKSRGGSHATKESALKTLLSRDKHMCDLRNVSLPLDPIIRLTSCNADNSAIFKSALLPVKLSFNIQHGDTYTCIFKQGDDLRQDQLIIQMIRLMDTLFKKDQLDLRLTPYSVLATGIDEGFVQFVKARPLRVITDQYKNDIKESMREARPGDGPFGIEPDVIDNYVRSLAGYSVITYVLGIGDRHLDNVLLCENGKLFHVDFGFILGRDPKLGPPPMKLTAEMVNAMGGVNGSQFSDFVQYCDSAYRILRRHSNILLNLFSLMLDAGIPDIASEPDKALFKIEQRLRLELSDEAATKHIFSQIETSIHNSKLGTLSDIIHGWKVNLM
ncbi:unnamed protein product [Caenorhabditis angaria]|uniref:Phosphatidylinositol 3-kinase catalytic subunit type 3 n=1 Tax=Caenorhabditis angaria TaxID=860376 RepID=A0A9P1I5T6_9PELO|nr:unnamed protein product [Caenorhabditis angaria]